MFLEVAIVIATFGMIYTEIQRVISEGIYIYLKFFIIVCASESCLYLPGLKLLTH